MGAEADISQCTWPGLDVEERSCPVGCDGGVVGLGDQGTVGMGDCTFSELELDRR